jgi:hypothetical protein
VVSTKVGEVSGHRRCQTIQFAFLHNAYQLTGMFQNIRLAKGRRWRKAAGHGHVRTRRQDGHATQVGSGPSLTQNGHQGPQQREAPTAFSESWDGRCQAK